MTISYKNDGEVITPADVFEFIINHPIQDYPIADCVISENETITIGTAIEVKDYYTTATSSVDAQIIFEGIVVEKNTRFPYKLFLESKAREMDQIKPSGSYSGRTDEIITSLITDNCDYITKDTFSAGTAMGTVIFIGDKTFKNIIDDFATLDGFLWYLDPEGAMFYNDGSVDSGEDLDETSGLWYVKSEAINIAINRVEIKGGIKTDKTQAEGAVEDAGAIATDGTIFFKDTDSSLITDDLCTAKAQKILDTMQSPPSQVWFSDETVSEVGFVQPGENYTFAYNTDEMDEIGSAQFIINKNIYKVVQRTYDMFITSGLLFIEKKDNDTVQDNSTITQQINTAGSSGLDTHKSSADHDGRYYTEDEIDLFKLNKWVAPDGAVAMGAQKLTGLAKGTDANDALALNTNLIDTAYDPDVWTEAEVAPSRDSVKDIIVPLTNAVVYQGVWSNRAQRDFTEDADGDPPTGIAQPGAGSAVVVGEFRGRKKVAHYVTTAASSGYSNFGNQPSGTMEWYMIPTTDDMEFRIRADSPTMIAIDCESVHCHPKHGNGGGGTTSLTYIYKTSFPHFKCTWDCGTDKYSLWIEGFLVVDDENFMADAVADNMTRWGFYDSSASVWYVDSVYYSWDAGYPDPPTGEDKGHWYLVDQDCYMPADGNTPERWYEIGDWIVWNPVTESWDIIRNIMGDNVFRISPGDSIQTAIDEIEAIGQGTIILLPGLHVIDAEINIGDINGNVNLTIEGFGDVSIIMPSGDSQVFDINDYDSLIMKDFKIDATYHTTAGRYSINCECASDNKGVFENITFYGDDTVTTIPLYIRLSDNCIIRNCTIIGGYIGIFAYASNFCQIYENTITGVGTYSIYGRGMNYAVISDNYFVGSGEVTDRAIYLRDCYYNAISDNYINDCVGGIGFGTAQSNYNSVIGNRIIGCSTAGVLMSLADYNSITANVISTCGDGIQIENDSSNNYITVNMIYNSTNEDIDDNSDGTNYILERSTDTNTIGVNLLPCTDAIRNTYGSRLTSGDWCYGMINTGNKVDSDHDIIISILLYNSATARTVTGTFNCQRRKSDGSNDYSGFVAGAAMNVVTTETGGWKLLTYTLDSADLVVGETLMFHWNNTDASDDIVLSMMQVTYNVKR